MRALTIDNGGTCLRRLRVAACACLLLAPLSAAAAGDDAQALQALTAERTRLTAELDQYHAAVLLLDSSDVPPEQSGDPAVRKLAEEMVSLKTQLIAVVRSEVNLLQQQIAASRAHETALADTAAPRSPAAADGTARASQLEATVEREREAVQRLHQLLEEYHTDLQEATATLPSEEELAQRERALRDAQAQARIPFSTDKVRLNGAEGSTALTQITRRLMDANIPESRRDIALICVIKTRLYGTLVGSESRSLKPVGKNHYIARVRLHPGTTTLNIQEQSWEVQLPDHANAADYLLTLYRPPGGTAELHVFAVHDLLAEQDAHIPAWLPAELKITSRAG